MTTRVLGHLGHNGEAELLVEPRRLETVRREYELAAAAADGLCLRFGHQTVPDTLPAKGLGDPDLAEFTRLTPSMAGCSSNDALFRVAEEDTKAPAIRDSSCGLVELVDSIFEILDGRQVRLDMLKVMIKQGLAP